MKLSSKVNLEYDASFFHTNLLKKFDWQPFSNIGTSTGMSECVCRTRLKKSEHGFCSLFTLFTARGCKLIFRTRGRMTRSLNFSAVPILLQGRQSNFFRFFLEKKVSYSSNAVMFHQSWGKLRPFFFTICNFHDKSHLNMSKIRSVIKLALPTALFRNLYC